LKALPDYRILFAKPTAAAEEEEECRLAEKLSNNGGKTV
jgi:hypothetical protein